MNHRRRLTSIFTLFLVLASTGLLRAQAYTNIVVFGDSLSDTGNFARLSQNAYGIRIPGPLADYTDGRFTDGSDTTPAAQLYAGVWIEQLAATLAAKPAVKASLDGGTDFAFGSATNSNGTQVVTYGPGNSLSVTINNVGLQISKYLAGKPAIDSNTLFVVWGGANDLLNATSSAQIVAAGQLDIANVQTLINAGATNIIVPNLPPLGLIPRLNTNPLASATATGAAQGYNQVVAGGLAALPAANPGKTLHIYLLDTYSLFNTVLVAPTPIFGLVNVTKSSQGLSTINPDTYLFWDDLHPTTAVHHILSQYARNLLTETTSSGVGLTLGTANAVAAQSVTLKAVVAGLSQATPIPTGYVTFYNGATPLVTVVPDNTGTATASFSAPATSTTPYAITAQFSGDPVYTSSTSSAQPLTVVATPVATTLLLTSSNPAANLGAPVTFTAAATSIVGTPSTSVNFMDGSTLLATTPLTNGTATYTTSTLTAGPHTITATLVATSTFAASTSATLTEVVTAPAYTFTATPSSLTVTAGSGAATTLTLTPVGGYTGTFTLACGTLPAHASCTFSNSTLTAAGNNAPLSSTLNISTYFNATSAALSVPGLGNAEIIAAFAFLPCLGGLALAGRRRRRDLRTLWMPVVLLLLSGAAVFGSTGCGSNSALHYTPVGTYQVPVTLSSNGAVVQTVNVNLTVQ